MCHLLPDTGWRCLTVAVQTPSQTCTGQEQTTPTTSASGERCCQGRRSPLSLRPAKNSGTGTALASRCSCVDPGVCVCVSKPLLTRLCRHTHELKLHQLLVRVGGWEQVKPVSVDKVGVFFRYAAPDRNNPSNTVSLTQGTLTLGSQLISQEQMCC